MQLGLKKINPAVVCRMNWKVRDKLGGFKSGEMNLGKSQGRI